jgi:hypothetical protein
MCEMQTLAFGRRCRADASVPRSSVPNCLFSLTFCLHTDNIFGDLRCYIQLPSSYLQGHDAPVIVFINSPPTDAAIVKFRRLMSDSA